MRSLITVAVVAIAFSSFTVWLMESWIKYPFFLFEILTIFVLYVVVNGYRVRPSMKHLKTGNVPIGFIIDLFFVIFVLLISNGLHTQGGLMQLVLVLLSTSILSGHALLNIFGLTRYFSKLESIILSYLFSYTFTGLIMLTTFFIDQRILIILVLCTFIVLGSISALKHKNSVSSTLSKPISYTDFLVIILVMAFYALAFSFMYPGFALLPGTDISRHYASSIVLSRTPDLYINSGYLLANLHESMILLLSNTSLIYAQMALLTLDFMLPLAFFVMAKPYLERIDSRLPSLATLFWALFTNGFGGFTWLYFANLKLSMIGQTQLQLLATTADKTYNGTIYGLLGLWYVPATVSLVILMFTILLIRKKEIPTSKFVPLFSIMIVALYLTHVTEAVIFAIFLAIYGAISRNENLRVNDSIESSIIGFLVVIPVYYVFSLFVARFTFDLPLFFSLTIPILALLLSLVLRRLRRIFYASKIRLRITRQAFLKTLVLPLLFVYTVSFLFWASVEPSILTAQFDSVGLVPWFMYPLMLGLNGLLAILALYYLVEKQKSFEAFKLFIAFMIFAFIAGKLVSIINIYFFDAGYWEKRFVWFIKIPLAILAPVPVILSIDVLKKKTINDDIKTIASAAMIGMIVLCGISTAFLNLDYWNIMSNNPTNQISATEMNAINAFREMLDNDPRAWLTTITDTSSGMATFAGPADMLGLKQLLYTAQTPEMAFTQLYRHPAYSHPYIYLANRDTDVLHNYDNGFLTGYLKTLPPVFSNSEVEIYNVSKPSFPQPYSDNALLIPPDNFLGTKSIRLAYQILSQGFVNYTTSYELDQNVFGAKTIILPFDPITGTVFTGVFQDAFNQTLGSWSISKGYWSIEGGHLAGGHSGGYTEGIMLSPVLAENFTSAFTVEPENGNAAALNYVSLVYSWMDPSNYRIADVLFSSDGYVHVLFRSFVNGAETAYPAWPGVKTDLKWDFNSRFDVEFSVNGNVNEISINNKTYLSLNFEKTNGRIGLRYYRFCAVSFENFSVAYSTRLDMRPVEDYLNYLRSGGKIIVLNMNGYGYFAHELFSVSNTTLSAQRIEGTNVKIDLSQEMSVPILSYKSNNTTTVNKYVAPLGETPLILHQNCSSGELFYVNVYPIVEAMQRGNQSGFYELLGKLLDDLNPTKLDPDAKLSFDAYVKAMSISNGVKIETDSLLFPQESEIKHINIEAGDQSYTFYNVTDIFAGGSSKLVIRAENASTQDGDGFYTRLQMDSAFVVEPALGSFALKVITSDRNFELDEVNHLLVDAGNPIQLLVRTPTIDASEIAFVEFYPQGNLQSQTKTYGQSLKVRGVTEFSIMLSDTYSIITNIKLGAFYERDPPIPILDLSSTLPAVLFWSLVLLPIFISVSFIFMIRKPSGKDETTEEEKLGTVAGQQVNSESEGANYSRWS